MTLPESAPAKNAKRDEWAAYARRYGIVADKGATRAEIIAAVEEAAPEFEARGAPTGSTFPPTLETKDEDPAPKRRKRRGAYFSV